MLSKQNLKRIYKGSLSLLHSVKPFKKRGVVIVLYHSVGNSSVSKRLFEEQLLFLKENYTILKLDDLISYLRNNQAIRDNRAAITFDDGYRDNYEVAYPVLKCLNIPATIYLTASYLDSGDTKYLSWEMAKEMVHSGLISIGDHTYSHPVLSNLKKDLQEAEIASGRKRIEDVLGINVTSFAYPYGQAPHFSKDTIGILKKSGYHYAVTAFSKKIDSPLQSVYEIPRVPMDGAMNMKEFEIRLSEFWGKTQWYLEIIKR
jgi:peptidoglycan/xylan/chitin deacetylase (PgdA/CDA1 family)